MIEMKDGGKITKLRPKECKNDQMVQNTKDNTASLVGGAGKANQWGKDGTAQTGPGCK